MSRIRKRGAALALLCALAGAGDRARAQAPLPVVPKPQRGQISAERTGTHDAANIRTLFYNFGMVGDFPLDPQGVDLSVFHSVEVPKGTGMNYSDGITPFVLAKIPLKPTLANPAAKDTVYLMETGFRERQAESPYTERIMRFEPRPGYFEPDPSKNPGRSIAISSDPRTWPSHWPDKVTDPDDPGWSGSWNGYFGKRASADQESYSIMDDDYYDALKPRWLADSSRDTTRGGLGLKIGVRGFQWANPQADNVIFWHYDITNESTTDYDDNIIFGLYMDSGVGGSLLSCDGIFESDDDNAFFDKSSGLNLVYTWDRSGHGRDLRGNCSPTGYLGYAYLETPGNPFDKQDNDNDGVTDERRDGGPGQLIVGQQAILDYLVTHPCPAPNGGPPCYDTTAFVAFYGPLVERPAFRAGRWWTGDEDMDWLAEFNDVGADGVKDTHDLGEGDGIPTEGEPNFDRTDLNESDQIGLTGFKMNRIKAGQGNPDPTVDGVLFYTDTQEWPRKLYEQFTNPDSAKRFDPALAANYNIGFLFASGPFQLKAGQTERFSLALAFGQDLPGLRRTVKTVQQIYNGNYQFAVAPTRPIVSAEAGDHTVKLTWDDAAERSVDPVTNEFDFEGYRIYRSTDPDFLDARVVTNSSGQPTGNGQPIAQFDLANGITGFFPFVIESLPSYFLGTDTGVRHTFEDPTVTNGQDYYYAVCAYDRGSEQPLFYPSENSYSISRTLRGGVLYPTNVVKARPNPRVTGFERAKLGAPAHVTGRGSGEVSLEVANSTQVPNGHRFRIEFANDNVDSVRASRYALIDSTTGESWFTTGNDFVGSGRGPVGSGILPVVASKPATVVDTSYFVSGSPTNARLLPVYEVGGRSVELKRPGFPENIVVRFDSLVVDTGVFIDALRPAKPAKFRVFAETDTGETQMDFFFRDTDNDGTLSRSGEFFSVLTRPAGASFSSFDFTWRVSLDNPPTTGGALRPPTARDVWRLQLEIPFEPGETFSFTSTAETSAQGSAAGKSDPYVVPNPYLGAASFEPAPFNIKGRGERRIEFRGVALGAVVRIYNVHGDLVQTLRQDGSFDGFVPWNLRTKDNLDVAPGLYIFRVDAPGQAGFTGKFAVVK
jgi:hypothetical protein